MAAVGSSSSAVVWTDPGCIGLQIAHGWRLASTVVKRRAQERPSSQQQTCQVEQGLDALRCVPHWPEVRARSSGRAAPDARSVCYSLRIGEEDRKELARGGLSGNPASKGEGRARVDSRGVREECHAGGQWIVSLARLSMRVW